MDVSTVAAAAANSAEAKATSVTNVCVISEAEIMASIMSTSPPGYVATSKDDMGNIVVDYVDHKYVFRRCQTRGEDEEQVGEGEEEGEEKEERRKRGGRNGDKKKQGCEGKKSCKNKRTRSATAALRKEGETLCKKLKQEGQHQDGHKEKDEGETFLPTSSHLLSPPIIGGWLESQMARARPLPPEALLLERTFPPPPIPPPSSQAPPSMAEPAPNVATVNPTAILPPPNGREERSDAAAAANAAATEENGLHGIAFSGNGGGFDVEEFDRILKELETPFPTTPPPHTCSECSCGRNKKRVRSSIGSARSPLLQVSRTRDLAS